MVYLRRVIPVPYQHVVEYLVIVAFQIGQIGRHRSFSILSNAFRPGAAVGGEDGCPESLLFLDGATGELRLAVFLAEALALDILDDGFNNPIENESAEGNEACYEKEIFQGDMVKM